MDDDDKDREREAAKSQARHLAEFLEFTGEELTPAELLEMGFLGGVEYQKDYVKKMKSIKGRDAQEKRARNADEPPPYKLHQVRAALDDNEGIVYRTAKALSGTTPSGHEIKVTDAQVRRWKKQMDLTKKTV